MVEVMEVSRREEGRVVEGNVADLWVSEQIETGCG